MQIDLGSFRKALSSLARGIARAEAALLDGSSETRRFSA